MEVIAIIPARGGSKGIPRKNLRRLNDKPLVAYSILCAKEALEDGVISRIIVSTEDPEIAAVSRQWGAEVIDRPAELASDEAPTEPCMEHVVSALEKQGVPVGATVLLQPTSPLRPPHVVRDMWSALESGGFDSMLTLTVFHGFLWKRREGGVAEPQHDIRHRPRRQDIKDPFYKENGSVYITRRDVLMGSHNRLGGRIGIHELDEHYGIEIDTEWEFLTIERLLGRRLDNG